MNKEFEFDMAASGNIRQTVVIYDGVDLTLNQLIAGLKSGRFVTSTAFCETEIGGCEYPKIYQITPEFKEIGYVKAQEALDDMEYTDFEGVDHFNEEEEKSSKEIEDYKDHKRGLFGDK